MSPMGVWLASVSPGWLVMLRGGDQSSVFSAFKMFTKAREVRAARPRRGAGGAADVGKRAESAAASKAVPDAEAPFCSRASSTSRARASA